MPRKMPRATPDRAGLAERVRRISADHDAVQKRFFADHTDRVVGVAEAMAECLRGGGKLLFFGNGGSAADAQHLAAEFVGRFVSDRRALPAISLSTDTSILTAVANDYGYDRVFSRQVEALGSPGDVAVGITTSGTSPSVVAGLVAAREKELVTVAFLGRDGGDLADAVDHPLVVAGTETARIQEVHILVGHALCDVVESILEIGSSGTDEPA